MVKTSLPVLKLLKMDKLLQYFRSGTLTAKLNFRCATYAFDKVRESINTWVEDLHLKNYPVEVTCYIKKLRVYRMILVKDLMKSMRSNLLQSSICYNFKIQYNLNNVKVIREEEKLSLKIKKQLPNFNMQPSIKFMTSFIIISL